MMIETNQGPSSFRIKDKSRLDGEQAAAIERAVNMVLAQRSGRPGDRAALTAAWEQVQRVLFEHAAPFEVHEQASELVYRGWDARHGPPPVWIPAPKFVRDTNVGRWMADRDEPDYAAFHAWTAQDRADFWSKTIDKLGIVFRKPAAQVLNLDDGPAHARWLDGAELNITDSCFLTPADRIAIIRRDEGGPLKRMSYGELRRLSARVANGLTRRGFRPGDALAVDMPMTAESVAIYLGVIQAGCCVVSIADSFAPHEIATRLTIGRSKAVFTVDHYLRRGKRVEIYSKVRQAGDVPAIVLCGGDPRPRLRADDVLWEDFLGDREEFESVVRRPGDHTNILFSSGTTGAPKAIPWTHTTPIKCAADAYLHHDIQPHAVLAWPTNLGWMMGPWLIYASLMNRAAMALYTGAPTGRDFGEFVSEAGVTMLGVVPSLVKTWRETACMEGLDWSRIRSFGSTGECSNASDMHYLMFLAGNKPVVEYCGGTEIGGGHITGTLVQPAAPATFSTPALGIDFVILDEAGHRSDNGEIFLIPPSIGLSGELLNRDNDEVYYEGCPRGPDGQVLRRHGDQVERLGGGYFRAHGRADDTMNLGGIKVSSAEIERVLCTLPGVSECAAIASNPPGGGPSRLVVHVVPAPGSKPKTEELKSRMQKTINQELNPLFRVHDVVLIDSLPRTASNKVMRRELRKSYDERAGAH